MALEAEFGDRLLELEVVLVIFMADEAAVLWGLFFFFRGLFALDHMFFVYGSIIGLVELVFSLEKFFLDFPFPFLLHTLLELG